MKLCFKYDGNQICAEQVWEIIKQYAEQLGFCETYEWGKTYYGGRFHVYTGEIDQERGNELIKLFDELSGKLLELCAYGTAELRGEDAKTIFERIKPLEGKK